MKPDTNDRNYQDDALRAAWYAYGREDERKTDIEFNVTDFAEAFARRVWRYRHGEVGTIPSMRAAFDYWERGGEL